MYMQLMYRGYFQRGRPVHEHKQASFEQLCNFLDSEGEHGVFTLTYLHKKLLEFAGHDENHCFSKRYIMPKLQSEYGNQIYFAPYSDGNDTVLCFQSTCSEILKEFHKEKVQQSEEDEKKRIFKTCAKLLLDEIRTAEIPRDVYPTTASLKSPCSFVPSSLLDFMKHFSHSEERAEVWSQNFIKSVRPRSGVMPHHLGLTLQLDHRFGSKWLINKLHSYGYCESYHELMQYKWQFLDLRTVEPGSQSSVNDEDPELQMELDDHVFSEFDDLDNDIFPEDHEQLMDEEIATTMAQSSVSTSTLPHIEQYVGDNVDIDVRSVFGNAPFHTMGQIRVQSPEPEENHTVVVPRRKGTVKSMEKSRILKKSQITIIPYPNPKDGSLECIKFRPFDEIIKEYAATKPVLCPADITWFAGWLLKCESFHHSNWKGFMKGIHPVGTREKSLIQYLPIIDGDPNALSTIYTLMIQCIKSSVENCTIITFDFPIWIKAVEISLSKNLPVILRLGGFHHLRSFLGAIGNVMESSGLEDIFKIIYSDVADSTIVHIMSGGAYYKSLRAHFIADAALVQLIMDGSLDNVEMETIKIFIEKCVTEKMGCEVTIPEIEKFKHSLQKKIDHLQTRGRTPALWLWYHRQVSLIKIFIRAERLHDWKLHLACVAEMLTTLAAAGHTQYAKGSRLSLELIAKYKRDYPNICSTFLIKGLHTVRYTNDEWGGVWSDLAIEQKFMREAKTSGGLTGGRFRVDRTSAHSVYCSTLNHMVEVNMIMGGKLKSSKTGKREHIDNRMSTRKKDGNAVAKVLAWYKGQ